MRFGNSVSETVLSEDSAWFRSCAAAERGLPSFVYLSVVNTCIILGVRVDMN